MDLRWLIPSSRLQSNGPRKARYTCGTPIAIADYSLAAGRYIWGVKNSVLWLLELAQFFVLEVVSKEVTEEKVSAGLMPAGPQLAATQMATERTPLSVRFIRNGVELVRV